VLVATAGSKWSFCLKILSKIPKIGSEKMDALRTRSF